MSSNNRRDTSAEQNSSRDLYVQQEIPLTKKMKRWFRMADLFAYPVTLKYKGERRFNTNFGAMTSIIIFTIMGIFILS